MRCRLTLSNSKRPGRQSSDRLIAAPSTQGSITIDALAWSRAALRSACTRVLTAPAPSSGLVTQRCVEGSQANARGVGTPCEVRRAAVARLLVASAIDAASQPSQSAGGTARCNCASRPSVSGATSQTASCRAAWRATKSTGDSPACACTPAAPFGNALARAQVAAPTLQPSTRSRSATIASRIAVPMSSMSSPRSSSPPPLRYSYTQTRFIVA